MGWAKNNKIDVEMSQFESFLEKLKEQSFTIIVLVGVMYYQNHLFTKQMEEYKRMVHEKEDQVTKVIDSERQRLLEREKYLMEQRDKFIDRLEEEASYGKKD